MSEDAKSRPNDGAPLKPPVWLFRALFESLLIIFSVVLALGLNEWREDRARQERVDRAQLHFAEEICANRAKLTSEAYYPYHLRVRSVWKDLRDKGNPTAEERARAAQVVYTGFHLITLRDAVWRSVSESALMEHMPPRDVFLLADIYRQQDFLDTLNNSMMNAWRQPDADAETPTYIREEIAATYSWLGDVVYAEKRLLSMYDEALEQLRPERAAGCGPAAERTGRVGAG